MRLIDADALKEKSYRDEFAIAVVTVEDIDNAPTVEPEKAKEGELVKAYTKGFDAGVETVRPKGRWIFEQGKVNSHFKCSNCGRFPAREVFVNKDEERYTDMTREDAYRFCFNCGADMRGDNDDG